MTNSREDALQKARQARQARRERDRQALLAKIARDGLVIQTRGQIRKLVRSWKTDVPVDCIVEALEGVVRDLVGRDAWEDRVMKNAAEIHEFWWSQRKGWKRSRSQPARAPQLPSQPSQRAS